MHTVPQQPEVVRDLLRSCSRGRTAGPPHNVLVLLQQAVDETMHVKCQTKCILGTKMCTALIRIKPKGLCIPDSSSGMSTKKSSGNHVMLHHSHIPCPLYECWLSTQKEHGSLKKKCINN